jgi:hypothetical protein
MALDELNDAGIRRLLGQFNLRATEPLFASRVVVLEGPLDVNILYALLEKRFGIRAGTDDVLLVPAGGKEAVAKLCELLERLGVPWKAVVDWDACLGSLAPAVKAKLTDEQRTNAITAAELLESVTSDAYSRGRKLTKTLRAIAEELRSGVPNEPAIYDSSILERLLKLRKITAEDRGRLIRALSQKRRRDIRKLLNKYRVWLWSGEIEDAVLQTETARRTFEKWLIETNRANAIPDDNRGAFLRNQLGALAYEVGHVQDLMERLVSEGALARSEMNAALNFVKDAAGR